MATQVTDKIPQSPSGSAEQFFQAVLASNPFERNRISDPSQMDCDVTTIHAPQFERLTAAAEAALASKSAQGVLLLGSAGTGKSHLLARLDRWAKGRPAYFVFLHNIQVHPDDMSRYLLKCCLSRLAQDRSDRLTETALFRLVATAAKCAAGEEFKSINENNRAERARLLAARLNVDERVFSILFQFFFCAAMAAKSKDAQQRKRQEHLAALALRWLKGELLDADDARLLGLRIRPQEEMTELPEEQVESVLLTLARLAAVDDRPFVLCIDQADNMKADQLTALSKAVHSQIDHGANLLVVVSGVREEMMQLIDSGVITDAAADRLHAKQPIIVTRIKTP